MKQTTAAGLQKSQGNGNKVEYSREYAKLVVIMDAPYGTETRSATDKVNALVRQFDQSIMGFTLGQLGTCIKYNAGTGIRAEVKGRCLFVSMQRGRDITRICRIRFKS